jgi:hypothetical protein
MYLGTSPQYARTVDLVLSIITGLVSPQFHIEYVDTFLTIRNNSIPKSMWQYLTGFEPNKKTGKTIVKQNAIPWAENNETVPPSTP